MFEYSCGYGADLRPKWARRVQAIYGDPSTLAPAYGEALKVRGPRCRKLSNKGWRDAVTLVLREAGRRAADVSATSGVAVARPTAVHVYDDSPAV